MYVARSMGGLDLVGFIPDFCIYTHFTITKPLTSVRRDEVNACYVIHPSILHSMLYSRLFDIIAFSMLFEE
jgi:hypothetical protein